MDTSGQTSQPLSMERLHVLRTATDRISKYLHEQTLAYLGALRPALVPNRVFGRYIEHPGDRKATGADKAWARLLAAYRSVAAKPYPIPTALQSPLAPIDPVVELYHWEYVHSVGSRSAKQAITVMCPAKWVVSFRSSYDLTQFRRALGEGKAAQKERIQQFVIHALVMGEMLQSVPGTDDLFTALRLKLTEEKSPQTGALPYPVLTSSVESHLPSDDVVLPTTQLTGVPRFTEIIDPDSVANLTDPLRERLQSLIDEVTSS